MRRLLTLLAVLVALAAVPLLGQGDPCDFQYDECLQGCDPQYGPQQPGCVRNCSRAYLLCTANTGPCSPWCPPAN